MTTIAENDLKELKELIINRFDELKQSQIELEKDQVEIKAILKTWQPSIEKIYDLSEKVGELKNWRQLTIYRYHHYRINQWSYGLVYS